MAYYGQARTHQPLGEEANIEKQLQQQQQSVQCSASVESEIKFATADYTDMQLALLLMLMRDAILDSRSYRLVRYWQHSTRERERDTCNGNSAMLMSTYTSWFHLAQTDGQLLSKNCWSQQRTAPGSSSNGSGISRQSAQTDCDSRSDNRKFIQYT